MSSPPLRSRTAGPDPDDEPLGFDNAVATKDR